MKRATIRTCARGHEFTGEEPCPECWPGYRTFALKAKVWLYPGEAAWHFLTLPRKESDVIKERFGSHKRGWGSLRVTVTIGKTSWKTSVFPDKKAGAYLLPLKAEVRKAEKIEAGDDVTFSVEVHD